MESTSRVHHSPNRKGGRRPTHDQHFANYLPFGFHTTICLAIFFVTYATFLLCLVPLLRATRTANIAGAGVSGGNSEHHYDALKPAFDPLVETYKHFPKVLPSQILAGAVRKRIDSFREQEGYTDASILKSAAAEFRRVREQRSSADDDEDDTSSSSVSITGKAASGKRNGFIVLGMHRSGTSMLSGLLVNGMGYETGGNLMGTASDNEKGFFERIDVVMQNDLFMKAQRIWWPINVRDYDSERALHDKESGKVVFDQGKKALKFFNDPDNAPWLQKDPRMCITLKTWLPLLNNEPAVLFTYRHPLQVARSLTKREPSFRMDHAFRVYIVYNMRAIQNSAGLCRVLTSNDAVLADPLTEVHRIADELHTKCGVPEPPRKLTQEDVEKFVDPSLQHITKKSSDGKAKKHYYEVVQDFGNDCIAHEYITEFKQESNPDEYNRERGLYITAMQIYCALQSGKAFKDDYEWPELHQ
jgi:hypothetical protein